ncbi:MAG: AMP-binding protein [Syntrophales bacterium]|nr:AMP-binding protein [Syntrophales bacterium]
MTTSLKVTDATWETPDTFVQCFLNSVRDYPDYTVFSTLDGEKILTYREFYDRVKAFAAGLYRLGVRRGDTVALMFKPRHQYMIADLAALCVGATPFSLYPTLPAEKIKAQLENADCRIAVCEQQYQAQMTDTQEIYPELEHIVLLEGGGPAGTIDWAKVEAPDPADNKFDFEASCAAVKPDDLITIIYTSGTTGDAKGCELTHINEMNYITRNRAWWPTGFLPGRRVLAWLPAAAVGERAPNYYNAITCACQIAFCEDAAKCVDAVRRFKPEMWFGPPRVWEKCKEALEANWRKLPADEYKKIEEGLYAGVERIRLIQAGKPVPADVEEKLAEADRSFFAKAREAMGFDAEDPLWATGGAVTPVPISEFFYAIGVPIVQCYAMSETGGVGAVPPRGMPRLDSVGRAVGECEIKLASDGEILIKTASLMRGYRKNPSLTAQVIEADGWYHTGDVGTMDADGWLRIVDRKKDIMINSMGKNMAPQHLEHELTNAGPFISQAMVIGEARSYVTALVTLDSLFVKSWAEKQGLDTTDFAALVRNPKIIAEVQKEVDKANEKLARIEQTKKFYIVGSEWLPGMEEVTPTMKIKRPVVLKKYAAEIDAMYKK